MDCVPCGEGTPQLNGGGFEGCVQFLEMQLLAMPGFPLCASGVGLSTSPLPFALLSRELAICCSEPAANAGLAATAVRLRGARHGGGAFMVD